ncbi:olfactory receptor 7A5-like [Sorex araneus]|uniref:olfactory receptor 7A5-like n=1 Tax=Sorex araneus TaxID=42254 RepID=UPI002433A79A|nr:olfactory receptor 7A5-like [Sorex araneus]
MEPGNATHISEFLLQGFLLGADLQPLLFGVFLSMYLITVLGNLLIILAILWDPRLHTPMYFFLCNLSLVDMCSISATVPKTLANIQTQRRAITFAGCLTQMYFVVFFSGLDNFILTVMAYDRFVAICHPLHYAVIMNPRLCGQLVLGSWTLSALHALLQICMVLQLSYGAHVDIPHFFCELYQVVRLACSDTFWNVLVMYVAVALLGVGPLAGILFSYAKIVSALRRMASAQGKSKAFSTCASHLSVVSLFYSTILGVYLSAATPHGSQSSSTASVMYAVVTPMLNPFIYSLRNKDIKRALSRFLAMSSALKDSR